MTTTSFRELIDELGSADSSALPLSDRPGRRVRWKAHRPQELVWALLLAVGLGLTAGGLALAHQRPNVRAGMDGSTYRVGDLTLRSAGPGLYTGAAAVAITTTTNSTRATSTALVRGRRFDGACVVDLVGVVQHCVFRVDTRHMTSVDRWTGGGWSRHYDDGETVTITADTPIPVPIPVGWAAVG